jgi:FtsP/CotA-like multicopper oxidase with cupredoxin domain
MYMSLWSPTGPECTGITLTLIVQDAEEDALGLPSGHFEHLLVLQDRTFDEQNQFVYRSEGMRGMMANMNGFLGDQMMVNGKLSPTKEVDAAVHRIRLINGSNSRIYKLAWSDDRPMVVIGGDGGLLEKPITKQVITLAPSQRVDLLLDLTGLPVGADIHLESKSFPESDASTSRMGSNSQVPNGANLRIMTLRTNDQKVKAFTVPERLSTFDSRWTLNPNAPIRTIPLSFQRMTWLIAGRTFEMSVVTSEETVKAGSTHIWEFVNQANRMGMEAAHPIHIHGPQFRVISRTGGRITNSLREGIIDSGWKDTVLVLPGETVRVQVTFTNHLGIYLYHCHILEHEDMGMMRNFRVT